MRKNIQLPNLPPSIGRIGKKASACNCKPVQIYCFSFNCLYTVH